MHAQIILHPPAEKRSFNYAPATLFGGVKWHDRRGYRMRVGGGYKNRRKQGAYWELCLIPNSVLRPVGSASGRVPGTQATRRWRAAQCRGPADGPGGDRRASTSTRRGLCIRSFSNHPYFKGGLISSLYCIFFEKN